MCTYMYIYTHRACVHTHIYIYMYIYVCIYVYIHFCIYRHAYTYIYIHTHTYAHVHCMCLYVYILLPVYIYTIHAHVSLVRTHTQTYATWRALGLLSSSPLQVPSKRRVFSTARVGPAERRLSWAGFGGSIKNLIVMGFMVLKWGKNNTYGLYGISKGLGPIKIEKHFQTSPCVDYDARSHGRQAPGHRSAPTKQAEAEATLNLELSWEFLEK